MENKNIPKAMKGVSMSGTCGDLVKAIGQRIKGVLHAEVELLPHMFRSATITLRVKEYNDFWTNSTILPFRDKQGTQTHHSLVPVNDMPLAQFYLDMKALITSMR